MVFVLLVQGVVLVAIPNSDAYNAAKLYLRNNAEIKNEIGDVEGFSLIPFSGLQINSVNVLLVKNPGTEWIVDKTEE